MTSYLSQPKTLQTEKKFKEEKAREDFYNYRNPLLVFYSEESAEIKDLHGNLMLRSSWKIIKHRIDSFYRKHRLTDKRVKEINEQRLKEWDELIERCNASCSKKIKSEPVKGSIYLLQLKGKPIYKIGISSDPRERLKNIQNSIPLECTLIRTISLDDLYSDEKKLHKLFDEKKISLPDFKNREWFRLNKRDLQYLRCLNLTNPR